QHQFQVPQAGSLQALEHLAEQVDRLQHLFIGIANADAAAQVEVVQLDARFTQAQNQRNEFFQGIQVGCRFGDLRADVAVHTDDFQPGKGFRPAVDFGGTFDVDAELVFLQPRGDVRVGVGVDVGVHAQRNRCDTPAAG